MADPLWARTALRTIQFQTLLSRIFGLHCAGGDGYEPERYAETPAAIVAKIDSAPIVDERRWPVDRERARRRRGAMEVRAKRRPGATPQHERDDNRANAMLMFNCFHRHALRTSRFDIAVVLGALPDCRCPRRRLRCPHAVIVAVRVIVGADLGFDPEAQGDNGATVTTAPDWTLTLQPSS